MYPRVVNRTVEATTTRIPAAKPRRNDAARIGKKYPKKKTLFVPLLRVISAV